MEALTAGSTSNLLSVKQPPSPVWRSVFLLIQALIQTIFLLKSTVCTILFTVMHRGEENTNRKERVNGRVFFSSGVIDGAQIKTV